MLYFLLFIEGFIGLAFQLLFLRQTEPHIGNSNAITGWIIGFFLLALSIGYRRGGKPTPWPFRQLGVNLVASAAIAGIGMSQAFLEAYFSATIPTFGRIGSLALFCTIVVFPVAYWMGQSLPLLIQRTTWGRDASDKGGNALFLSTLGSFGGAIATPNILLYFFGAANTLLAVSLMAFSVGAALILPSGFWQEKHAPRTWHVLIGMGFLVVIGAVLNTARPPNIPYVSTAHADMFVVEDETSRYLWSNQLAMSVSDLEGKNDSWYIDETARLMDFHQIDNADITVLGAGGFMLSSADKRNNRYHYIDIDPVIQRFVAEHFNADAAKQKFTAQDARAHLIETPTPQDVIYLDTFSSRHSLPRHLLTQEFFQLLKTRIKPDGLLLINAILDPAFNDPYSRAFHQTLISVFPYCLNSSNYHGGAAANVIYHCRNRQEPRKIYTDNINHSEYDSAEVMGR